MNAELKRATQTEDWTQWERQIVNGVFPLRRLLGCSAHSAVFLTEHKSQGLAEAAIKLVRTDAAQAQVQLSQWQAAAALSHPHLVRLFEVGRWQSGGHEFVFAVMEHADQTLAGILRHRPLNADEVRELLVPTLDAITFLHRRNLAHGQLKPSNFLAIADQLKLASDTLRPAGHRADPLVGTSSYDAPELSDQGFSTAGDIWSLGVTLVEALTQRTPAWSEQRSATDVPDGLPAPLADTVRRCLSANPSARPTAVELRAQFKPASPAATIPEPPKPAEAARESTPSPQPPAPEVPRESTPAPQPPEPAVPRAEPSSPGFQEQLLTLPDRPAAAAGVFAGGLLILLAVWIGLRGTSPPQADLRPTVTPTPTAAAPSVTAKAADSKLEKPDAAPSTRPALPPAVLHEVTPEVPQNVRNKVQGRIFVMVRVLVDPSGNVVGALMEDPGRSKYFARLAENAAREWRFVPSEKQRPRVWILKFAFTRDGATARVIEQ